MHKAKICYTPEGYRVRIDKDIADIIQMMWKLGIQTSSSCQAMCQYRCKCSSNRIKKKLKDGSTLSIPRKRYPECKQYIWLVFEESKYIEKFYNLIAEFNADHGDHIYNLMMGSSDPKLNYLRWHSFAHMNNYGADLEWYRPTFNGKRQGYNFYREVFSGKNDMKMSTQLFIPRLHIPYVRKQLQKALENHAK